MIGVVATTQRLRSSLDVVNADRPGVVGTDMWVTANEWFAELTGARKGETYEKFVDGIPLGRRRTRRGFGCLRVLPGRLGLGRHDRSSGLIEGGVVDR